MGTIISVFVSLTIGAVAEEIDAKQFLVDYKSASKDLSLKYATSRGTGRIVMPHLKRALLIKYFSDHGFTKYEVANQSKIDERTTQLVECLGETTGFSLALRGLSKEYQVTSLGVDKSSRLRFNSKYGKFGKAPFEIFGTPLYEFLNNKTVRNVKVVKTKESNRELIKVTFENGPADKPNIQTILLLPKSLAIRFYETIPGFVTGKANPIKYDIEYLNDQDQYPIPKRVKFTDPNLKVELLEWESFSFDGTPEKEFSMEHYNLPDVSSAGKSKTSSLLSTGMLISLTLGLVGFVIKRVMTKTTSDFAV